jgi:hypothetical protein
MKKKYILNYKDFIFEQAIDPMAGLGGTGMEPAAPAPKKQVIHHFLFLDPDNVETRNKKKYPDGSLEISYPTFSVTADELKDWAEKNIVSDPDKKITDSLAEVKRKNILEIVKGDKTNIADDDFPFIEKLRHSLATDMLGKRKPDVTVVFSKNGLPTTDDIDVTFIKYKN